MKAKRILLALLFSIIATMAVACGGNAGENLATETRTRPTPEQLAHAREVQADLRERLTGILEDISPDFYPWVPMRAFGEHVSTYSMSVSINVSAHCIISEAVNLNYLYADIFAVIRQVAYDRDLTVTNARIRTSVGHGISLTLYTSDNYRFIFTADENHTFADPIILLSFSAYRFPEIEFASIVAEYFSRVPYYWLVDIYD